MSKIEEKLNNTIDAARRSGDKELVLGISMVKAKFVYEEKKLKRTLNEDERLKIIGKEIKELAEEMSFLKDEEKINALTQRKTYLEAYMPKEITDEELTSLVNDLIVIEDGKVNIGKTMKALKASKMNYSGRKASELVRNYKTD